jgi:hypothetical protein
VRTTGARGARPLTRASLTTLLAAGLVLGGAGAASAHPLGNFTVNHYDGLRLFPDRVEDLAVLDTAEIPTLQERPGVDADGDGEISAAERSRHAAERCAALAAGLRSSAGGQALRWRVTGAGFAYRPGAAGLSVSRLECRLSAPAALGRPARLDFTDGFEADRIGWHEITAVGADVRLIDSPVPSHSLSDELRAYPNDLLSSPLDIRSPWPRAAAGHGHGYGHGHGLSATLTAVGLLLVRLRHRLDGIATSRPLAALSAAMPPITATLVPAVGIGLTLRAAAGLS